MRKIFAGRAARVAFAIAAVSLLCAVSLAVAGGPGSRLGLGTSVANAAPVQYYSGALCSGCWHWDSGWNYHVYNEAFNTWNTNGPLVGIVEHHTDGHWVYEYYGPGEIDICHAPDYTETACRNSSSGTLSVTCYKETGSC